MNTLLLKSIEQATGTKDRPRIAVSYLRVSTKRQAEKGGVEEGFSIPAQRAANKQKAESMGAFVVKDFVDKGESARTADRPALQEMLEYIKSHPVDYVIVHKLDRLARNRADDVEITNALTKVNVQLISTTEAFDDSTPSGSLMHGVMSSVSEYYSKNLAMEVKKGMLQKVQNGGTPGKAPLGYLNLIVRDDMGRENRTVILDEERAPLIRKAFTLYSQGDYTMERLATELATEGLTTLPTAKIASKPVNKSRLHRTLVNPYYCGVVQYNGTDYEGSHPQLVDPTTWQKVQEILASHRQGERTRTHKHFLKSTLYCGQCYGRMYMQVPTNRTGETYYYFMCGDRHNRRNTCTQRSVQIHEVEKQLEEYYATIHLSDTDRDNLRKILIVELDKRRKEEQSSQGNLQGERKKILQKRRKLLEMYYADAIPPEMFKEEQDALRRALADIDLRLATLEQNYDDVKRNLDTTLDLVANVGKMYKKAPDHIKRMLNQVFFKRVLVRSSDDVQPERTKVFEALLSPQTKQLAISGELLCSTSSRKLIFYAKCLSNILLVQMRGLEPPRPEGH